jgi:hypothetical protein
MGRHIGSYYEFATHTSDPGNYVMPAGRVRQEAFPEYNVLENITLRDHVFYPGMITRVTVESGGFVWVITHGVGVNSFSGYSFFDTKLGALNQSMGPLLFRALDTKVQQEWTQRDGH